MRTIYKKESPLFLKSPRSFLDGWREMIMPSFTALLSLSSWHVFGDLRPFLASKSRYERNEAMIFLCCPGL